MRVLAHEEMPLGAEMDVLALRHAVRSRARELDLSLADQTKLVTAASELARNAVEHGGGGRAVVSTLEDESHLGIELVFEDRGPGIGDPDRALQDGYTTGRGLGLGLGGARRLVDEFELSSAAGSGTRVRVLTWK